MTKERAAGLVNALRALYPDAECTLYYGGEPWQLLVMARLSAQCTDKRVNLVCKKLFERYPAPELLAAAELSEVEELVKPCGLYRVKAADIISECQTLTVKYGGLLPDSIDELLTFRGVGRKIANLLVGDIYGKPSVVVDTHCLRVSARLGLIPEGTKDAHKAEMLLKELIDPEEQTAFCHRLVDFGREYCTARARRCGACPLFALCPTHSAETDKNKYEN